MQSRTTRMAAKDTLAELMQDRVQVVDVRSPAEFAGGHAPGGISVPLLELDQRIQEQDPGATCPEGLAGHLAIPDLEPVRGRPTESGLAAGTKRLDASLIDRRDCPNLRRSVSSHGVTLL